MKTILTNSIVDPNTQQPFYGVDAIFLQTATKEILTDIGRSMIGDTYSTSIGYMMFRGRIASNIIGDGFIFYNDEWYRMTGADITAYSNVPVIIADNSFDAMDPVTFSDGSTHSVHQIKNLKIADQVTGTGLFDYSAVVFIQPNQVIVGSGGSAPAYGTNWSAYTQPTIFRKNKEGLVTIQGAAVNTTSNTGTIFTLPAGFRPSVTRVLKAMVYYSTTTLVLDILVINTTGVITILGLNAPGSFSSTIVYFDVSFYAD